MDIADDADGRVAIFTVDAAPVDPIADPPAPRPPRRFHATVDQLGRRMDETSAVVAIAVALVVVLVLGLLLLRR